MNIFHSRSNSKPTKGTSLNKKRLSQEQVRLLEASFNCNKKLDPMQKLHLALQLGIPPRQITIWYQNKRARWKIQSLELDYTALQLRLEATLSEKRQLEKEIQQLRAELHNAKEALLASRQQAASDDQEPPPVSSFSSGTGHEGCGGSTSSLHDDISCSWEKGHHEALQLEELYACLMGTESSTRNLSIPQNGKYSFLNLHIQ